MPKSNEQETSGVAQNQETALSEVAPAASAVQGTPGVEQNQETSFIEIPPEILTASEMPLDAISAGDAATDIAPSEAGMSMEVEQSSAIHKPIVGLSTKIAAAFVASVAAGLVVTAGVALKKGFDQTAECDETIRSYEEMLGLAAAAAAGATATLAQSIAGTASQMAYAVTSAATNVVEGAAASVAGLMNDALGLLNDGLIPSATETENDARALRNGLSALHSKIADVYNTTGQLVNGSSTVVERLYAQVGELLQASTQLQHVSDSVVASATEAVLDAGSLRDEMGWVNGAMTTLLNSAMNTVVNATNEMEKNIIDHVPTPAPGMLTTPAHKAGSSAGMASNTAELTLGMVLAIGMAAAAGVAIYQKLAEAKQERHLVQPEVGMRRAVSEWSYNFSVANSETPIVGRDDHGFEALATSTVDRLPGAARPDTSKPAVGAANKEKTNSRSSSLSI